MLASFSGSEAKVKQPLRCISFICSYMRTLPIKVGDRNLGNEMARFEANSDFQRDYYKRRKLARRSPGADDEVSVICFPHKLRAGKV